MLTAVIYAKLMAPLAAFYEHVFGLAPISSEPGCVVLRRDAAELTIVQARPEIAATIQVATPPEPRTGTPIELVFPVASLAGARVAAAAFGGAFGPDDEAWVWRGWRHLDGVDPEGNVVQAREPAP